MPVDARRRDLDHPAPRGVLGRIGQQIRQNLFHSAPIAQNRRHRLRHVHPQCSPARLEQVADRGQRAADQARRVEGLRLELDPARFESTQVEQVTHQADQARGIALDGFEKTPLNSRQLAGVVVHDELQGAFDCRERRL